AVAACDAFEECPPRGEQIVSAERGTRAHRVPDADERRHPGQQPRAFIAVGNVQLEAADKSLDDDLGRVAFQDPESAADDLSERPECHALAVGQAATTMRVHGVADAVDVLVDLPPEPRLADTGRPKNGDQARPVLLERGME